MIDLFKQNIASQFEAALCTLNWCIEVASPQVWAAPVARYPFSQVAFHSLFFADYYLGANAADFREQLFHKTNPELFADYEQLQDREPVSEYRKDQMADYVEFCRQKALASIANETEESLAKSTMLTRSSMCRFELYLYNIRHIQHHAAQMILRLRLAHAADAPWIGSGWRTVNKETS